MDIRYDSVKDTDSVLFARAIAIYLESFPANERHPEWRIRERVEKGFSKLIIGVADDEVICMALLWDFKESEFVLLDYLAVKNAWRGEQVGSAFFRHLQQLVKSENRYLLLEVEDHRFGGNREQKVKRIKFYLRNGAFQLRNVTYLLPALDGTCPTEMVLMMTPAFHMPYLTREELKSIIQRLYFELYMKTYDDSDLQQLIMGLPEKGWFDNSLIDND
jgi:GNAT superfamily N-acetyltransferase